jgi:hypothetical protein
VGETVTLVVVAPAGFQVYVEPPEALKVIELPIQMDAVEGLIVMLGTGATSLEMVYVDRQPAELIP